MAMASLPGSVMTLDDVTEGSMTRARARVTLVCISDTHGFEASEASLPEGDVLIHCGDFAPGPIWPGGTRVGAEVSQRRFDAWLASQPHGAKVVVRGNHDPVHAAFPLSGATYATSPRSLDIAVSGTTLRLALCPYQRPRKAKQCKRGNRFALPSGEVLVSHVPPHGVRDRCHDGDLGGCAKLRHAVERSVNKPRLWLCGHIHEARGATRHRFGADPDGPVTTLVVNVASANEGVASRLEYGATVVTLMV